MLIDWFTVAAQVVNFLFLVWLLKRFLYKPVLAAIAEREKRIAAELQDAEKKKAEALKEQADFQQKNEEFDRQRASLLLEATNAAKIERDKLLEAARKDAEALRSKLRKSVHDELENVNRKIVTLAQREVFSIAQKVLMDLAGASLQERMIDLFSQRLRELPDKQKEDLKAALHASSTPVLLRSAFELAPPQKAAIAGAIEALLGKETGIEFEVKPDLIGGIELAANGQKIAWSIADYLTSLTRSVTSLLEPKIDPVLVSKEPLPHAA
jgi:F-type H+-transporting ATPase subunit b